MLDVAAQVVDRRSVCGNCGQRVVERLARGEVPGGTEVTLLFTNLPPGLRPEDNDAGAELSLEQLARRFE